ncbi:MAG: ATP-grasp domain-containing protein [Candidatus Methylacidiphilales bacterium]
MSDPIMPQMPVVLSEAGPGLEDSASARDIAASTEVARLQGFRIYGLVSDFEAAGCENAEDAFAHIPVQQTQTPGFWIGFIPNATRYEQVWQAAWSRGIRLVNSPEEHRRAQEFAGAYPLLAGLTPLSAIVKDVAEAEAAITGQGLGYPVFVKGNVQSRKARGWKACVAANATELQAVVRALLELTNRSRGRIILRQLAPLRYERVTAEGFRLGREYRVFLLNNIVVGMGYYWEGQDSLSALSPAEDAAVRSLAIEASRRLAVPFVTVDIGQCEDGAWIVIECGDAQFSGLSQISPLQLWNRVRDLSIVQNAGAQN